jgi:peptidoglycan/xylan/chitin deacetylase (PgdA/CDA1 family)
MYHSISSRQETHIGPYYRTVTSPERFREHLMWLKEAGASVIPLTQWNSDSVKNSKLRVVITFDDGFADFAEHAAPVLQAYSYPATMFLPTGFIETSQNLLPGIKHLSWSDVERLRLYDIEFGSHTVSHPHLKDLSNEKVFEEIQASKEHIEDKIGQNVTAFACPYAFPQMYPRVEKSLISALKECGYSVGVTTRIGRAQQLDNPFTLKRIPVNNDDDRDLFLAKLHGGYDWMYGMQFAVKLIKQIGR